MTAVLRVTRWDDIDRAKGLAIFLVVLGHAVARDMPVGAEWFAPIKWGVYGFHMAFFMFISGFVFFKSSLLARARADYGNYARQRILRFMPAYVLFALFVWSAKLMAENIVHVDNSADGLNGLFEILIYPTRSPVSFLWYIWILMLFQLLTPCLLKMCARIEVWVFVSAPLLFLPTTFLLGFDKVSHFFFFFLVGGFISINSDSYLKFLERSWKWLLLLFGVCVSVLDPKQFTVLLGTLAIPALHGLVRWGWLKDWNFLATIGGVSYAIYLMNTIAIGGVKAVALKFVRWDSENFLWLLPLLVLAGMVLPILVKKFVFSRIPWLNKITS
jgi:uncharacterized membrane protein YcfT